MKQTMVKELRARIWYVVILYLFLGISWILFSDSLVLQIFSHEKALQIHLYKGLFFVLFTTALLFLILRKKNKSIKKLFFNTHRNMEIFRDTFEQTAVGMAHNSVDGDWLRVNKKFCSILGYKHEELMQTPLSTIIHPNDLEESRAMDEKLTSGQVQNYVMEKRYITKSGQTITGRLTKTAIKNDQGEINYLAAIIEDITEQKKVEEALEQSLREKEKLLNEVHHRVKNNLAVISGLLELQVFSSSNKIIQKILKESMMRIKSMALIHESYYKSGTLTTVSLDEYLGEFASFIQRSFSDKNQHISLDYFTESISLNINQAVSCGLLLNELLVNAYQHAFPGQEKGTITISLREESEKVILQIADDGIGLPDSIDVNHPASLGITIIHTLVKQLGGSISLHRNKGTTFVIDFVKAEKSGSASNITSNSVL